MGPKVLFLHPDLGIGGAERLVLDAALALQERGCSVEIWTSHYDSQHCFPDSCHLRVFCAGDWLPRSVWGRCAAICAYLRMVYLALYVVFLSGSESDVFICDQVSACIPFLKLSRRPKKILFYCHFPDQLLTPRRSLLKRLYRTPIDWLEERTTGMADCILVNSKFTADVFKKTFKSLSYINPDVLYPSLNSRTFDSIVSENLDGIVPKKVEFLYLSINRYERKKNILLAIEAFHNLLIRLDADEWEKVHLIVAGGYDERVLENVEHYEELKNVATKLQIENNITFLRSFSDDQKMALLRKSTCILYTPSNEHFGIVPVEAMYMECPVIAVNSGGPLESILNNSTGFLCNPSPTEFSEAMEKFLKDPGLKHSMGAAGKARVKETFSSEAFSEKLYQYVCRLS
ncbi:alpha-1,3/1,6-mannosyltransferase ALG2 [Ambystoma mexicanum]|uniref:alpha-1,3/1,6-mannosyltransferase ALG2 n=1 Tax=Ambystoma mexicanum TaxID=8296 RepID=UPI0037E816C2